MSVKSIITRSSKSLGLGLSAAVFTGMLAAPISQANAGVEIQSFQVKWQGHPALGVSTLGIQFTYIENDEPDHPVLLDLGDGTGPFDILRPGVPPQYEGAQVFNNPRWLGTPVQTIVGPDLTQYKIVKISVSSEYPKDLDKVTINVVGGLPIRHDVLNHDGGNVSYGYEFDAYRAGQGAQPMVRNFDLDLVSLSQNKKHSYDLPSLVGDSEGKIQCELVTGGEGEISSVPSIKGRELRITKDCKLQWDTTGAKVGDRYAFKYVATNEHGDKWMSVQTIEIVGEDLNEICEVTPSIYYREAYRQPDFLSKKNLVAPVPARLAWVPGEDVRSLASGGNIIYYRNRVDGKHGTEPAWVVQDSIYSIDWTTSGSSLVSIQSGYHDVLPILESTHCPVEMTLGCKDSPERDRDGDGVCNLSDNCPDNGSSDNQWDSDGDGLGDLCDPDADGDGVGNQKDVCGGTSKGEIVDSFGCSVQDLCPCPDGIWALESQLECTRRESRVFRRMGLIDKKQRRAMMREARRTNCDEPLFAPWSGWLGGWW